MKTVYSRLPISAQYQNRFSVRLRFLLGGTVSAPVYWALSHFHWLPGLTLHYWLLIFYGILCAKGKLGLREALREMALPLDSVRYFECDFVYNIMGSYGKLAGNLLDISSPRNILIPVIAKHNDLHIDAVNPDKRDLATTKRLFSMTNFRDRCRFYPYLIDELPFEPGSYNIISSISVLEHIPEDELSVRKLWSLLKPGGILLLSVPCSASAFVERINFNEYGLLSTDSDGYLFGQRFYDETSLRDRIFSVTGRPNRSAVYGEIRKGYFFENRARKNSGVPYPFWHEPYLTATNFQRFASIGDLTGLGVIAMEFVKK
jgi:SAM-dependent methyltransferase